MAITLGWWMLPAALTVAAWVPFFRYRPAFDYDFGGLFVACGSFIATLIVWLVYFIIL